MAASGLQENGVNGAIGSGRCLPAGFAHLTPSFRGPRSVNSEPIPPPIDAWAPGHLANVSDMNPDSGHDKTAIVVRDDRSHAVWESKQPHSDDEGGDNTRTLICPGR